MNKLRLRPIRAVAAALLLILCAQLYLPTITERLPSPYPATGGAMTMMRIGFVLPSHFTFTRGNGVRQEALLKQRGLLALGHQVELCSPWQTPERGSLDVVHFFYGGLPMVGIDAVAQVEPRRLVYSPIIDSNQALHAYRLAALLGSLVPRIHTTPGEFRRQCRLADAVVVRSRHEQRRVVVGLGIAREKVHLVHLGIDVAPIDVRRAAGTDREGIFHLSAFGQARKNVLRLIAAVGPTGLPLTIAGSCGPLELKRVAAAAGPFPNITIRGFLSSEERDELYYRSRVFALPSMHEGTGLAALEAAARGCGVVITNRGGPPDYFGEVGHLVDPDSIDDVRAKLVAAYRDSAPAQIAAHITSRFASATCASRLVDVYLGRAA